MGLAIEVNNVECPRERTIEFADHEFLIAFPSDELCEQFQFFLTDAGWDHFRRWLDQQ